jgi:hypothetical protein
LTLLNREHSHTGLIQFIVNRADTATIDVGIGLWGETPLTRPMLTTKTDELKGSLALSGSGRLLKRLYPPIFPQLDVSEESGASASKAKTSDGPPLRPVGGDGLPDRLVPSVLDEPFGSLISAVLPPMPLATAVANGDAAGAIQAARGCAVDRARDVCVVANTGRNCLTVIQLSTGKFVRDIGK